MASLVVRGLRCSSRSTNSLLVADLRLRYSTEHKEDSRVGEVAHKARSTAEEFLRQAKEKKDEMSESAKEAWEDTKEAVAGETTEEKEEYKHKVEKGDYHNIGRRD
ncbi:uncharacterized protein LOC109711924 [Ananas comosus]|uniref:Uncharacterized protein LOC109711924 n=1 Tax=Ananas comosus TaxID=4615 RepID=A0A199VQ72_ANACO|nr:uncharacterized protein LOC109711924 [Ananas comosus]OAY79204.1 hypothetical protein ACMD2_00059 [Ananas comosus]